LTDWSLKRQHAPLTARADVSFGHIREKAVDDLVDEPVAPGGTHLHRVRI
jgi:hypothetical protein